MIVNAKVLSCAYITHNAQYPILHKLCAKESLINGLRVQGPLPSIFSLCEKILHFDHQL